LDKLVEFSGLRDYDGTVHRGRRFAPSGTANVTSLAQCGPALSDHSLLFIYFFVKLRMSSRMPWLTEA